MNSFFILVIFCTVVVKAAAHLSVALMAEGAALVLDEAEIRQLLVAHLAAETLGVPGGAHRLQYSPQNAV